MTRRLFLSTVTAALVVGTAATAEAASDPFDNWGRMFQQSMRQSMRWHPPKYHARKPMPVKAAPGETPAATPPPAPAAKAEAAVPDSVLPIPAARPAETPAAAPAPAAAA